MTTITKKSKANTCPLCDSELRGEVLPKEDISRLREIDKELSGIKQITRDVHKKLERLRTADSNAREQFDATKEELDEFDRQNSATLSALRQQLNVNTGDATLKDYRDQLAILEKEKKTAYDLREGFKRQLLSLQNSLEQHYVKAERTFVPSFAKLAQHFLGMPLTVQMDSRPAIGLNLIVTVRGEPRRQQQHLSESQRFFLDIALRMALTQHMSDDTSRGGMYIDTPEGSLDIAYEKRAGDMLAMFSRSGHRIIMTANLNSSQLLLTLAHECGRDGIQLCRMTDWAELSEVQQEEEALFDKAYREIEKAMGD
jgi:DNA repair exonuclease SbcCD ATPase subunit